MMNKHKQIDSQCVMLSVIPNKLCNFWTHFIFIFIVYALQCDVNIICITRCHGNESFPQFPLRVEKNIVSRFLLLDKAGYLLLFL